MAHCQRIMYWLENYKSSNTFNSGYNENWIVFAVALNEVKRVLQKFVLDVFIKGLRKEMPDVMEEVKRLHRNGSPAWENTSRGFVALESWSIIKCFLPKTGYRNLRSYEDLDISGLLSLITTCRLFDETVTCDLNRANIFSELQDIHRQVFRASIRDITRSELRCYLEKMIELLTDAKTIWNTKKAKEATQQIRQVLCSLYDVKHRPQEIVSTEIVTRNTSYYGESDTRASDMKTGLADSIQADFGIMTALLKATSNPEDSRESLQPETRNSHEKTVDGMPVPDVLQAYRAVTGKDDIHVRPQDLPAPDALWMNGGRIDVGVESTAEQTENVKFQQQEQTLTDIPNPNDVSCCQFNLMSNSTEYRIEDATEVKNQHMIKTTEQLGSVQDPDALFQDQSEFDKGMIVHMFGNVLDFKTSNQDKPEFDSEVESFVSDNDKCEGRWKTVSVETRNQDLTKREKISDKHLDDTDKLQADAGRHLDETGKHFNDTDTHLGDTDKHLDVADKYLDDTDKHQNEIDKILNDTCRFSVAENSRQCIKGEAEIEETNWHLNGDDDTRLGQFCEIITVRVYDAGRDSDGQSLSDAVYASDGEDPSDAVYASDGEDPSDAVYASTGENPSDAVYASTGEDPSDAVYASDGEDPSDAVYASTGEDPSHVESGSDFENPSVFEYLKDRQASVWKLCCELLIDPFDDIACVLVCVYKEKLRQAYEEKLRSSGNKRRHVITDRWIRFEGEPEINLQQSLKKRRGSVFGTDSTQDYISSPARKKRSKILTSFVLMFLFCLSNAAVKGTGTKRWVEEKAPCSCNFLPSVNGFKVFKRVDRLVKPSLTSKKVVDEKHLQMLHVKMVNFGKLEKMDENVGDYSVLEQPSYMPSLKQSKINENLKQPGYTEFLNPTKFFVFFIQPKYLANVKQPMLFEFLKQPKYNEILRLQKYNRNLRQPQYTDSLRQPKYNVSLRQPKYTDSLRQPKYTDSLRQPKYTESLKRPKYSESLKQQKYTWSLIEQNYNETTELLDYLLLNDSDLEAGISISEEDHFLEFQHHTVFINTENAEQCDIGEVYRAILTELFLVVMVAGTYSFLSIKGDETNSWIIPISCFVVIILMFGMRPIMKQEFQYDHDTFSGDEAHSKNFPMKWGKYLYVAVVVLFLSLLDGLFIDAFQVLHVKQSPFKSYQIDAYYDEHNLNYDTGFEKEIICSEQVEFDLETAGIRSRNSCHYCEEENEQEFEDCICLENKHQTITYNDIENERQLQQNLNLAEDLYDLKSEKHLEDGKPLTVDENEVLVHEFSKLKPFSCPEEEDFLNSSDTDQELLDFEIEENQEKKDDSDSEDEDHVGLQNREWALKEHTVEQVEDWVNKELRQIPSRECIGGRDVQSASDEFGTDIGGAQGFNKKDGFCLFEVDDQDVSIVIPPFGASSVVPLDNTDIGNCNRAPEATASKKSKSKWLQVFPNQHQLSRQNSDLDVEMEKNNLKLAFQNLNYRLKVESQSIKDIDSTFTEQDFGKYLEIRGFTWLPLNQLPVPKLDPVSVAFVQNFEPLMVIIDQIANGTPPTPHVSMRYEMLRFCTLRSYPKENKPYLIKLAEAGFYYASDSDGVVCYCCGIRRYNWVAKDDPIKVHQRINPDCKFLKKNEEVNVPVQYFGPYSEKLMYIMSIPEPVERPQVSEDVNNDWAPERIRSPASAQQRSQNETGTNALGINTAIPKHPANATKTAREASYNGWPDSSSHTPQELSDAGFFYAGFGDCVRCFYCGIGLRHWTKEDDPWIEHARWSRNCVYLRQKKGEEFVNLVQLALQYSQDNASQDNEASENASASQDVEKILLSNAAQSVLEMGYQPRMIKKAIEEILHQNRNAKIVAQTLMEKLLEIEEAEDAVQTAKAPVTAEKARPAQQTAKPKSSQSEGTKGPGASNTEGNVKRKDSGSMKAKSQTNDTSERNKVTLNDLEKSDSKSLDPKTIKAENELLKEQTLCKVCLDNTVCIVFLPCGHLVTCADCAPAMRKCPICRALVKGTVRTYMS